MNVYFQIFVSNDLKCCKAQIQLLDLPWLVFCFGLYQLFLSTQLIFLLVYKHTFYSLPSSSCWFWWTWRWEAISCRALLSLSCCKLSYLSYLDWTHLCVYTYLAFCLAGLLQNIAKSYYELFSSSLYSLSGNFDDLFQTSHMVLYFLGISCNTLLNHMLCQLVSRLKMYNNESIFLFQTICMVVSTSSSSLIDIQILNQVLYTFQLF